MLTSSKNRIETSARSLLLAGPCCAALVAALVIVLAGCATPRPAAAGSAAAAEPAFTERAVQVPAGDVVLTGVLFTPAVTPVIGEHRPAIVLMHGCAGMNDSRGNLAPRHRDWAERFARWGFVTLTLDSFGPRGVPPLCDLKDRPVQPWKERTADANAALRWLAARADVDPAKVFVLGWSHGGSTVMGVVRPQAPGSDAAGPHFKAAVAFYPGCVQPLRQKPYRPTMPLLILHGEADDWTPAAPCVELAHKLQGDKLPVRTVTYAGAHHGFDQPVPGVHFLPKVYNPAMPDERGAHVGQNPQARLAAIDEVRRFIGQQLQP
jgi:dienelactone hydrolase